MKMDFTSAASTLIKGVNKPRFIYGTAWKKTESTRLVQEAIAAGFTAIDTAAQPRHYREDLVGEGLRQSYASGIVTRDQLYIQTKYTSPAGQDVNNMPYDPSSPLEEQIRTSLASSFHNLRPLGDEGSEKDAYIDCLVMHSPLRTAELTVQAWKVLETYVPSRIRHLGISNVSLPILEAVWNQSTVKPAVVQNRFYADTAYEVALRRFCCRNGIQFQSFWTLTGNPRLLAAGTPAVDLARSVGGVSKQIALYSLVMSLGVTVLNGTTTKARMTEDLEGILKVKEWADTNAVEWESHAQRFKGLIGESLE